MKWIFRICGWMILLITILTVDFLNVKNIIGLVLGISLVGVGIYLARYKLNWWKSILMIILPLIILTGSFILSLDYSKSKYKQKQEQFQNQFQETDNVGCIIVYKSKKTLQLRTSENGKVIKTYKVELGFNPKGTKRFKGDGKTPEGTYRIIGHHPNAEAYKGLYISYPNAADKAYAKLRDKDPGGCVMIHGLKNNTTASKNNTHPKPNWTAGCVAVTNTEMDEIYELVKDGTKIIIKP